MLVVEHEPDAGPEMFGHWLAAAGIAVEVCRPYKGDPLPERVDHGGLMVLGGSMGACDDWRGAVAAAGENDARRGRPAPVGRCSESVSARRCSRRPAEAASSPEPLRRRARPREDRSQRRRPATIALFRRYRRRLEAAQWHDDEITELPGGRRAARFQLALSGAGVPARRPSLGSSVPSRGRWLRSCGRGPTPRPLPPERMRQVELRHRRGSARPKGRLFGCWQGFADRFAAIVKEG